MAAKGKKAKTITKSLSESVKAVAFVSKFPYYRDDEGLQSIRGLMKNLKITF